MTYNRDVDNLRALIEYAYEEGKQACSQGREKQQGKQRRKMSATKIINFSSTLLRRSWHPMGLG